MRIVRISASQNWLLNGGKLQFPLDFIPGRYRIEAMHLEGDLVATAPAGGVTSEQQTLLLDGLECERRLRSTGIGESCADWSLQGKDVVRPAALAVGAGQAIKLYWPVAYRDPRFVEPSDFAPAAEYFRGRALDVYLKDPASIVAGFLITGGTAQLVVYLSQLPEGVVPASILKSYVEIIGKEVRLPAGRYVEALIVKNDGSVITEAEMGNMQLTADGATNLLERVRTPQLARSFNYFASRGTAEQAAAQAGEALPSSGSLPWVPLLYAVAPQKATKLPEAREHLILTFDGTLVPNTARVFYRVVEAMDEVATTKAAVKLGYKVTPATVLEPKTASKNGIPSTAPFARLAGIMARRIRTP